jgi:hypothetical protein
MSNWIKKGLAVVHITNLEKVMTVDHCIFQSKEIKTDGNQPKRVSRLIGIEVNIVNEDGKIDKSVCHSKELIPLSIANKGKTEAYRFYSREGEYENY